MIATTGDDDEKNRLALTLIETARQTKQRPIELRAFGSAPMVHAARSVYCSRAPIAAPAAPELQLLRAADPNTRPDPLASFIISDLHDGPDSDLRPIRSERTRTKRARGLICFVRLAPEIWPLIVAAGLPAGGGPSRYKVRRKQFCIMFGRRRAQIQSGEFRPFVTPFGFRTPEVEPSKRAREVNVRRAQCQRQRAERSREQSRGRTGAAAVLLASPLAATIMESIR